MQYHFLPRNNSQSMQYKLHKPPKCNPCIMFQVMLTSRNKKRTEIYVHTNQPQSKIILCAHIQIIHINKPGKGSREERAPGLVRLLLLLLFGD